MAVIPSEVVEAKVFKCEQCENVYKSENGLKIHVGKTHKNVNTTPPPPDRLRQQQGSPASMPSSPLLDASREELLDASMDEPTTPFIGMCRGDECYVKLTGRFCCEKTKLLCEDCCGHF